MSRRPPLPHRLLVLSVLLLPLVASAGRQAPRAPRYDDRHLAKVDLPIADPTVADLRKLALFLSDNRVRHWVRRAPDGSLTRVRPADLTEVELLGLIVALGYDLRGAEVDLFVSARDARRYPVSVWWDEPRTVVVQAGPAWEESFSAGLTPGVLEQRYGLTDIVDGDRSWDLRALDLLDKALARLSAAELARVRDVPFHRNRTPSKEIVEQLKAVPAAAYVHDHAGPRFEVYDSALEVSTRFAGTPGDAHRYTLNVVLHELGHAIAHTERRRARVELESIMARQKELFAASRKDHARLTRMARSLRSKQQADAYERELAAFEARRAENDALVARIDTEAPRLNQRLGTPTAAATALTEVLDKQGPPTFYGLTDPDECFADAFALYRGDPAALLRARPAAHAWFETGGHLQAQDPP